MKRILTLDEQVKKLMKKYPFVSESFIRGQFKLKELYESIDDADLTIDVEAKIKARDKYLMDMDFD